MVGFMVKICENEDSDDTFPDFADEALVLKDRVLIFETHSDNYDDLEGFPRFREFQFSDVCEASMIFPGRQKN